MNEWQYTVGTHTRILTESVYSEMFMLTISNFYSIDFYCVKGPDCHVSTLLY